MSIQSKDNTDSLVSSPLNSLVNYDEVFIEQLGIDASIGVFDWEKQIKQQLLFDLDLRRDNSRAAQSDDISDALDYVAVCEKVREICLAKHYDLLESLGEEISQALFKSFDISALVLKISKPAAVAQAHAVGVKLVRQRLG